MKKNIIQTLEGLRPASRFLGMIKKAGMEEALSGDRPVTLFVPNNRGCECVEEGGIAPGDFKKIVRYHMLPGKIKHIDLVPYKLRKTFHGKQVCLEAVNVQVNASLIILRDIECSNGVIHMIDRILIPKNVSCEPTTNYRDYEEHAMRRSVKGGC